MDAGQIYNSWPLMGSTYFPNDNDFLNIFNFSAFSDPSLVQFIHRNLAYLIFILFLIMFIKIYRNKLSGLFKIIKVVGILLFWLVLMCSLVFLSFPMGFPCCFVGFDRFS